MPQFPTFPSAFWAEKQPDRTAIVWKRGNCALFPELNEPISWRTWHNVVQQAVGFLQKFAMPPKPLIAYCGESRLLGLLCYSAVIAMGGRILMLNPAQPETLRRQILQDNLVDKLLDESDFANFRLNLTASSEPLPFNSAQAATLTLTSGSSGKPKAVVHTAQQHLANAEGVCERLGFSKQDNWLLSLPLFHVSGQGIVWRWLSQGATLTVYEAKNDFWQALSEVSHASLVPTQLQRYLTQPQCGQKAQKILLGGAFIPSKLIALAQQKQMTTYAGYGMTEMGSTVCAVEGDVDNVGTPLNGREVQIVEGEIWVRGAGLALGYWQNGEIQPLTNAQGWFATKDKGAWNEQGKLVVNGRLDNLFISGGENIQPEEIEQVLFASELVEQAVVVPWADDEFGFRPWAFVQFREPFSQQEVEKLQFFAKQRLEKFKQPVGYLPLPPTVQTGLKISRKQLQAELEKQTTSPLSEQEKPQ